MYEVFVQVVEAIIKLIELFKLYNKQIARGRAQSPYLQPNLELEVKNFSQTSFCPVGPVFHATSSEWRRLLL